MGSKRKFDFDIAQNLSNTLIKTADVMEVETSNIQGEFQILGETFKDKAYLEFQGELNAADKTILSIIGDIRDLNKSLLDYASKMNELL